MAHATAPKPDLLFDVDGVLVHPQFRFRDYLERKHGITPAMTMPFFRGRFTACVVGQADLAEELGPHLDRWGWPGTASSFIETWLRVDSTPDAALLDLVARLRLQGFRCHVASVQERNRATYLRQTVGFDRAFDATFFSCDLGAAKPDPAFYLQVQQQLAGPPGQLLLIDDSLPCVEAAHAAGWQAFHYQAPTDRARLAAAIPGFNAA